MGGQIDTGQIRVEEGGLLRATSFRLVDFQWSNFNKLQVLVGRTLPSSYIEAPHELYLNCENKVAYSLLLMT